MALDIRIFRCCFFVLTICLGATANVSAEQADNREAEVSHTPVSTSLLASTLSKKEFNQLMTSAHNHVKDQHWNEAETALRAALSKQSNSNSAQDLLVYVQDQQSAQQHGSLLTQIKALLQDEQWSKVAELSKELNSDHSAMQSQIEHAKTLAEIEQDFQFFLSEPRRFNRLTLQPRIERVTQRSQTVDLGERVGNLYNEFTLTHQKWTQPILVTVDSDRRTIVSILPGRRLGSFNSQTLRINPGDYEFSGKRDGFREVRVPISIQPGDSPHHITVIATEQFE